MYKNNHFTEEELKSLRVWESPGIAQEPGQQRVGGHPKISSGLTVDDIELIQKQAHSEAFAQGQKEGRKQGYEAGHVEGLEKGHLQGYQDGLKKGLAEAEAQRRQQTHDFIKLMESLSEPFKILDEQVEEQLVQLVIAIARQLIRREIRQHPGEIMAVVREAISILPVAAQKMILYLHPADAELVKSSLALTEAVTTWQIIDDPLMTQGGCKVATEVSTVDATIEKRLAAVIAMVLGDEREAVQEYVVPTTPTTATQPSKRKRS